MSEIQYTPEMVLEIQKCMADPKYFMSKYYTVAHPTRGHVLADVNPAQTRLVNAYYKDRFNISLTSRQVGHTTALSGYALWFAIFHPCRHTAIASPNLSGSKQVMRGIQFAYDSLPEWLRPKTETYNQLELGFNNGSVIVATTVRSAAQGLRGRTIDLFIWDSAAWCDDISSRQMMDAVSPHFSSGHFRMIVSSSGMRDSLFYTMWDGALQGNNGFRATKILWDEIPERDEEWKQRQIDIIGKDAFRREYLCEWSVGSDG